MDEEPIPPAPGVPPIQQAPTVRGTSREILGASVLGEPIALEKFGNGPINVLVLGGIHGDEVTSVDVTRGLASLLRADPALIPPGRTISIIEVANPDGYARKTRSNSRDIDLNRNFPARNFKAGGGRGFRGGSSPASEPETRAILTAIAQLRPRLIISVHSIRGGKQQNNYDGPGQGVAELMAARNGYPVTANIGYPTPGSLGSYAGGDLQIPVITLELPREQAGFAAWAHNREALLAAIRW
jgi:predicted deacylase